MINYCGYQYLGYGIITFSQRVFLTGGVLEEVGVTLEWEEVFKNPVQDGKIYDRSFMARQQSEQNVSRDGHILTL